jgi:hypothetical protein
MRLGSQEGWLVPLPHSPMEALTREVPQTVPQEHAAFVAALIKEFDQESSPGGVMHHIVEPARHPCVLVNQPISDILQSER